MTESKLTWRSLGSNNCKGDAQLISGFRTFLPKGFEITWPLEVDTHPQQKNRVECDQTMNKTKVLHDLSFPFHIYPLAA